MDVVFETTFSFLKLLKFLSEIIHILNEIIVVFVLSLLYSDFLYPSWSWWSISKDIPQVFVLLPSVCALVNEELAVSNHLSLNSDYRWFERRVRDTVHQDRKNMPQRG